MNEKILITSALPYANGPLHFGHIAGAYLPADCYARFERIKGKDVHFVCGSDEYGIAITLSADLAGRSPKEHVDIFHAVNQRLFEEMNFSFDHFSRTSWEGHVPTVQQFFTDLYNNGYIEERVTDQLYSEQDSRFLADRYVVGTCPKCGFESARGDECQKCGSSYEATDLKNPRSKITNAPLTKKPTKHWFLRFDLFKERLQEWLLKKSWKVNVENFAKSYIDDLKMRAITRDGEWGVPIPLPNTEGKSLYVWFDAPIGYISASKDWAQKIGDPAAWEKYWLDPHTKYVQFIGKDNIPFHAVFFPAMVMGQNVCYKMVDELPANEFLNLEGKQFSKSDGWTIDLDQFFKSYSADQIRYVLAANAPENQDSEFSWKDFQNRCNSELVGKYGNFANRVLVFAQNQLKGQRPKCETLQSIDIDFLNKIQEIAQDISDAYESFMVRKACSLIMELAQCGNVYFDAKKPWVQAKQESTRMDMETTLSCCLKALKVLALVSLPVIPEAADKLWKMLGFASSLEKQNWQEVLDRDSIDLETLPPPSVLFQRVDPLEIDKEIEALKASLK